MVAPQQDQQDRGHDEAGQAGDLRVVAVPAPLDRRLVVGRHAVDDHRGRVVIVVVRDSAAVLLPGRAVRGHEGLLGSVVPGRAQPTVRLTTARGSRR
ncbi:hypothetical protein Acsp06_12250 [Actinomycetospora sp. NBRC 106375]|nr:hypothetical protein Acsp06_12250 [Actinomycetospora sp. NBRC 106375]